MITTIEEIIEAKLLIHQAYKEVIDEGFNIIIPEIGIMVEVPAILLLIREVFHLVEFISIGSNDLTQYTLAVDRTNEKVSTLYNQLHPSMIRVFYNLAKQAHKYNKKNFIMWRNWRESLGNTIIYRNGVK